MVKTPDSSIIKPIPDRCQIHRKTLFVPAKPMDYDHYIWICIECVVDGYWNDDITKKVRESWPEQFRLGSKALREHLKIVDGGVKRKGGSGV